VEGKEMSMVEPKHPIMERIWEKAREAQKRIVLPETKDERVLKAAEMIKDARLAQVILIGNEDEVHKKAKEAGVDLDNFEIIDPKSSDKLEDYAQRVYELRKGKIPSLEEARNLLENDYLYFGAAMVKFDDADGMVAGASHTTADVLRPAFQIVKTAPGISIASAYFAMIVPDCPYGENGFFLYADSGGVPDPNAEELADIAITTCLTMKNIYGIEPYCAMLSFSTKGSASHPIVDKVIEATKIANEKRPDLNIDGELQVDAALIPEIGRKKAPGSPVAGRANVLIFPDLNSGNIAYKLTERLAKAEAYGPLIQGLSRPVNDLSRGCKPEDIVNVAAVVAVKAQVPYDKVITE